MSIDLTRFLFFFYFSTSFANPWEAIVKLIIQVTIDADLKLCTHLKLMTRIANAKLFNQTCPLRLVRFIVESAGEERKIIISNLMTSFSNAFSRLLSTLSSSCWCFLSFFFLHFVVGAELKMFFHKFSFLLLQPACLPASVEKWEGKEREKSWVEETFFSRVARYQTLTPFLVIAARFLGFIEPVVRCPLREQTNLLRCFVWSNASPWIANALNSATLSNLSMHCFALGSKMKTADQIKRFNASDKKCKTRRFEMTSDK